MRPEGARGVGAAKALLHGDERVDHRVADEMHALIRDALRAQVLDRLLGVQEEILGELVGDDPVDLLGHRAVEGAQARLQVGDRDAELDGHERRGQRRVDVARDDHADPGALRLQDWLDPLHHARRLHGMAG